MTFYPTEIITEKWGRLQVIIGESDVTYYRDVPTQVSEITLREPFSDVHAIIRFPGITSFEARDDLPFADGDNVEINQLDESGNFIKNLFEGYYVSEDDELSEGDNALTITCLGALYQLDYYIKAPIFNDYIFDIGNGIQEEINHRIDFYGLRLNKMNPKTFSNIGTRSRGTWNPVLTGWIQDLLAMAWTHSYMLVGEGAVSLSWPRNADPQGYWITGDLGTFLSFGEDFPNFGSWSHLVQFLIIYYNNNKLYLADTAPLPDGSGFWTLSREGQIEAYGAAPDLKDWVDPNPSADRTWAIESTSTGEGFWVVDDRGYVTNAGDAGHFGHLPTLPDVYGFQDAIIDLSPTPTDQGYYLFSRCGKVFAYGDAVDLGDFTFDGTAFFVSGASSWTGNGYYGMTTKGQVSVKGDAVDHGSPEVQRQWCVDLQIAPDDTGYMILRSDGYLFDFGPGALDVSVYGHGKYEADGSSGGNIYQWTLTKHPGRQVEFHVKDTWTVQWTATVGTPGITHSLARDWTTAPNVFYGEGIDPNGCRWRNSKYPNLNIDSPPLYPGYDFSVNLNQAADDVRVWQQAMFDRGWPINIDGVFGWDDHHYCTRFQGEAGLIIDGIVGPQTWNATFAVGENGGDFDAAYYAPLAQDITVEPFTYTARGAVSGFNPLWDPHKIRIERYDNFGEKVPKREAVISSQARLRRDSEPGYLGTITLRSDPEEGSRFDIREGQNILYKGYRGQDIRFHIAEVRKDFVNLTVTLTVDTQARDAMTVYGLYDRDRKLADPARTSTRTRTQGRTVEDRHVTWDCENGSGHIPLHALGAGVWQVHKIPVGEFGQVVQSIFITNPMARFSVGILDRPITAIELQAMGSPEQDGFWDQTFWEDRGLIIAWGGEGNMGGYYPNNEDSEDPELGLTGYIIDRSSWYYWSSHRPWIWVAEWADRSTKFVGRLYPGLEGPGALYDAFSFPEVEGGGSS